MVYGDLYARIKMQLAQDITYLVKVAYCQLPLPLPLPLIHCITVQRNPATFDKNNKVCKDMIEGEPGLKIQTQ